LPAGASSRFTFDPQSSIPVWSPDSTRIVFLSVRDGTANLYQRRASGAGEEELLLKTGANLSGTGWWRNWLLFQQYDSRTQWDLWMLPLEGERKPVPFQQGKFDERWGCFSPDGKWVAYQSNESGRDEIYVRAFSAATPAGGGKWPISSGGGEYPRWRGDGKEL